ncbi:MAG: hypothetical protein EON93_13590 [Burkholderiales bacterium]|nr:MAG: hypothetical protein EON93_13590 [Burkholderiales bacterium]
MTTRWLTGCIAALAAALSLAAPSASAQTTSADTVLINETKPADLPCPVPDVLADHELAVGCAQDVAELVKRLHASDACGSQTKYSIDQACAVIIYSLDPQFTGQLKLPPTFTVRIGKVAGSTPADTYVSLINSNGSEERLGPDRLYELLIPIRIDERVMLHADAGTGRKADQKVGYYEQRIRYYPALMVGRGDATRVMTKQATKAHFTMPVQVKQDLDRLLSQECIKYFRCS